MLAYCEDKMSGKINKQIAGYFLLLSSNPSSFCFSFFYANLSPAWPSASPTTSPHCVTVAAADTLTLHVRPFFRMFSDPQGGPLLLLRRPQQVSDPLIVDLQEAAETQEREDVTS